MTDAAGMIWTTPTTNPYTTPVYPLSVPSIPVNNMKNYFMLDPTTIAALNRLAAALEKYNERAK